MLRSILAPLQRRFDRDAGVDEARWIVLDVESTGLDPRRDRLLAIAAVGVHIQADRPRLDPADSFEVVLRQDEAAAPPDKSNILLHGIGVGAQRAGVEPALALRAFQSWAGSAPRIGFHVAFDRAMIERAMVAAAVAEAPGPSRRAAWLDLEPLAAVLHPEVRAQALDEWLAHFRIHCAVRHQAAADAYATAELLQTLWPALKRELPRHRFSDVAALAARRRWLRP